LIYDGDYWGLDLYGGYNVVFTCKNLTGDKFYQLATIWNRLEGRISPISQNVLLGFLEFGITDKYMKSKGGPSCDISDELTADAMILQLGDPDFQKREAATQISHWGLQDTDKIRNHRLLVKVRKAREHRNPEIKARTCKLYDYHKKNYLLEYPFVSTNFVRQCIERTREMQWRRLVEVYGDLLNDADLWVETNQGTYIVIFPSKNLTAPKLYRLRAVKVRTERGHTDNTNIGMSGLNEELMKDIRERMTSANRFIKEKK
jgi:hypothetical protein